MKSEALKEIRLLGVKVHCVDKETVLQKIEDFVHEGSPHQVITLTTEMVMCAQNDSELLEIINSSPLVIPDTSGVLWASRYLRVPLKEKIAGIWLVEKIAQISAERGWKLFLLGGLPELAEKAARKLKGKYKGLQIAGTYHGYFKEDEEKLIRGRIGKCSPQILLAGLGVPKQEKWLRRNLPLLGIPVGIGIGGSLDVISGKLKRAPQWMISCQIEWVWRLLQEPWRYKRMLNLPKFMIKVIKSRK